MAWGVSCSFEGNSTILLLNISCWQLHFANVRNMCHEYQLAFGIKVSVSGAGHRAASGSTVGSGWQAWGNGCTWLLSISGQVRLLAGCGAQPTGEGCFGEVAHITDVVQSAPLTLTFLLSLWLPCAFRTVFQFVPGCGLVLRVGDAAWELHHLASSIIWLLSVHSFVSLRVTNHDFW